MHRLQRKNQILKNNHGSENRKKSILKNNDFVNGDPAFSGVKQKNDKQKEKTGIAPCLVLSCLIHLTSYPMLSQALTKILMILLAVTSALCLRYSLMFSYLVLSILVSLKCARKFVSIAFVISTQAFTTVVYCFALTNLTSLYSTLLLLVQFTHAYLV